jgi:hypothetical protein
VVSDADFALRCAVKQRPKGGRPPERVVVFERLRDGEVTAAVQAPDTGDLFVGFKDGAVVHFVPAEVRSQTILPATGHAALGLATDAVGQWLAVLSEGDLSSPVEGVRPYALELATRRSKNWLGQARSQWWQDSDSLLGLLPLVETGPADPRVGVNTTNGVGWHSLPDLIPEVEAASSSPQPPTTHLRLHLPDPTTGTTLTFQGGSVSWSGAKAHIGWMPEPAPETKLFTPPLAWLVATPLHVELAGLFDKATLYFTEVERQPDRLWSRTIPFVAPGGFRAVAIWRPGQVVGVTSTNRVLWLRARGTRFEEWAPPTDLNLPARAAGCFPSRRTNEVLVLLEDATLVRVPVPAG